MHFFFDTSYQFKFHPLKTNLTTSGRVFYIFDSRSVHVFVCVWNFSIKKQIDSGLPSTGSALPFAHSWALPVIYTPPLLFLAFFSFRDNFVYNFGQSHCVLCVLCCRVSLTLYSVGQWRRASFRLSIMMGIVFFFVSWIDRRMMTMDDPRVDGKTELYCSLRRTTLFRPAVRLFEAIRNSLNSYYYFRQKGRKRGENRIYIIVDLFVRFLQGRIGIEVKIFVFLLFFVK